MHAVRDLEELIPIPVLILDRGGHGRGITTGRAGNEGRGDLPGDELVALRGEQHAVTGQRRSGGTVGFLAAGKEVDEHQLAGGGDFLDDLGVEGDVRVDGLGGRGALRSGAFFERQRGEQDDLRGGFAVIHLLGGVIEPAIELSPEGGDTGGALERFGITEPSDDHVSLETREPLVRRLGETGAGMAGAPEILRLGKRIELLGTRESIGRVAT